MDETVAKCLSKAYHSRLNFFQGAQATYAIMVGRHYEQFKAHKKTDDAPKSARPKGILDFLVFPRVARAILHKSGRPPEDRSSFAPVLFGPILLLLELARLILGATLTAVLIPAIATVQAMQNVSNNHANPRR